MRASKTLQFSILYGAVGFAVVSVLAYSIWAFRLVPGTAAMYSSIAAVYIALSGLALMRLVDDPAQRKRFPLLFALAFLIYAVCWCAFYFGLRGRFHADLIGSAAGLAGMTALFQRAFRKRSDFPRIFAVLFVSHALGYYVGLKLHGLVAGSPGMMLCGACHGFGFGAGLGYVLFHCQTADQPTPNDSH